MQKRLTAHPKNIDMSRKSRSSKSLHTWVSSIVLKLVGAGFLSFSALSIVLAEDNGNASAQGVKLAW